ncbi:DUF7619 domain-containing protein [Neolewinella aurantiaca]|nr:T9SS type A sorting domain-containing protein [Neolewinella aurantiaca]
MKKRLMVLALGRQCQRMALMLAALCLTFSVGAQGFEKKIGGPKDDFGQAILQTKDHGYIEVGSTRGVQGDDNDFDIFVVRTDVDGTTIWTRQYDAGFIEQAEDVLAIDDDNYLVLGFRQETPTSAEQTFLVQLDQLGRVVFSRSYGDAVTDERGRQIIALPNEEFLITGYRKQTGTSRRDILIIKVDANGDELFRTVISENFTSEGFGTVANPDGSMIVAGTAQTVNGATKDIVLHGLAADGSIQWTKSYGTETGDEQLENIIRTNDDHLVFVGSADNTNKALIAKANLNGDTLWYHEIDAGPLDDVLYSVIEDDNGESLVAVGQTVPTPSNLDVLMVKVRSEDGLVLWQRRLGDEETLDVGEDLAKTLDGGYALAGFSARFDGVLGNEMVLFKTNDLGALQTNYLQGKVYFPSANDCGPYSEGDLGLSGWLVRAESETATFFGSTDSLGNYELRVDADTYEVTLLQKNDRWNICGSDQITVDLTVPYDSVFHNFALQPAYDCPLLEVTASATPAIQCDTQRITLSYGNTGTDTAEDASIELILDESLTYISSGITPAEQNENTLIFDIGDLAPSTEGTIDITVRVACNDIVAGQAISSQVTIFPLIECAPVSDDWDGSSIVVTSRCDRVEGLSFTITNIGENPMLQTSSYVIVEDIALRTQGNFMLESMSSEVIGVDIPAGEVSTYRLIAEQSEGHPGNQFPTAVAEGCQTDDNDNTGFTTGYVGQFPDNDGNLNIDILTQEVVALDQGAALQLMAYPRGYQDSIIIPKTDIEYTVFFALPGNDSFERVVIRDTLPELLDFNSLEMGAASHPYDFVLYQGGILKITFDSIRIFSGGGTGEADAVTRQGYVSYRLSQKPNTTTGSVIRNRAAVYFDYESPLFSEEVRHVVGCNDLYNEDGCLLSTANRNLPEAIGVDIITSPNPTSDRTTVQISGWKALNSEFYFQLYDAAGRKVFRKSFRGDQFEFFRPNIAAGNYFYEIHTNELFVGRGQITFQ